MSEGNRWRSPGDAYWRWVAAPFALVALVWVGGPSESSQSTPWDSLESCGGTYWPCIIAVGGSVVRDHEDGLPDLANGSGRPWLVHRSRLRLMYIHKHCIAVLLLWQARLLGGSGDLEWSCACIIKFK